MTEVYSQRTNCHLYFVQNRHTCIAVSLQQLSYLSEHYIINHFTRVCRFNVACIQLATVCQALIPMRNAYYMYRVAQKMAQLLYALTSSNVSRFSKLFLFQNQEKTCNNAITKDPTTPQLFRSIIWIEDMNIVYKLNSCVSIFCATMCGGLSWHPTFLAHVKYLHVYQPDVRDRHSA